MFVLALLLCVAVAINCPGSSLSHFVAPLNNPGWFQDNPGIRCTLVNYTLESSTTAVVNLNFHGAVIDCQGGPGLYFSNNATLSKYFFPFCFYVLFVFLSNVVPSYVFDFSVNVGIYPVFIWD